MKQLPEIYILCILYLHAIIEITNYTRCQISGYRMRERRILRDGLHGGATCPNLKEIQPCHYPPCYTWHVTSMTSCVLKYQDAHCGEGMVNNTVECVSRRGVSSVYLCCKTIGGSTSTCLILKPTIDTTLFQFDVTQNTHIHTL